MTFADLQFVCFLSFTDAPEDDLAIKVGVISLHVKNFCYHKALILLWAHHHWGLG